MASEFIEIISPTTLEELKKIMPLVDELADKIKAINGFQASKTPSDADKKIKGMTDAYNAQGKALQEISTLQKQIEQNAKNQTKSTQSLTKSELDYVSSVERGIKSKEKEVLATKKLNDAYGQLTQRRNETARALQNAIIETGKYSQKTQQLQKDFNKLNKDVAQADKAIGKLSQANNGIRTLTSGVGNLMTAFGVGTGLYLAVDIVKGIYDTTKALQSMDLALKMVSETDLQFAQNKVFVTEVAEKWGLEIKSLQQTYTQFYTASKGLLTDDSIKTTFEGIAKAGSIMGLSLEQQQAAFYAIDQMMSKGTVTAEELKKQLGNAMPGAIKAAAMAYMELHPQIKSIQEAEEALYKDMKKGAIDSATYVPLIAKNFQILYGIEALNEVNTMQSAQNRLRNSYTEWIKNLTAGNSVTNKAVGAVNWLAKNLGTLLNIVLKGGTILGVYLGVTKAINFAMRQAVLITEAYAIAKSVLTKRLAQNATAETASATATAVQTEATIASTVATNGATTATNRFTLALLKNPIVAVIALIMAGVTAYILLRDSTDDATASLIKYEQAKRDAEKQAVKDVKDISKDKNALQERLEIEVRQLKRLREIQKTASDDELKEIKDRILAKETEIGLTKEKLRLEGINVKEKSKEASDKAYIASNKAGAERDSLELKRLKKQEELDKAYKKRENYDYTKRNEVRKNTFLITDLENELKTLDEQIRAKNVEITKQTKIFNELRPEKVTKPAGGKGGDGDGGDGGKSDAQKRIDDARREAEQKLKDQYDAELSNLKKKEELLSDHLSNEKNFTSSFKYETEERIKSSLKLAQAQIEVAERVYKEKKRLVDKEAKERGLNKYQKENLLIPITNEFDKSKQDALQANAGRISNIYSDFYKDLTKTADEEGSKFEKAMGKFKLTPEQEQADKDNQQKFKDDLKQQARLFNEFAGDFANKSGFSQSFDNFFKEDKNGVSLFDSFIDPKSTMEAEERTKATMLVISSAFQDTINLIDQAEEARHQRALDRLEREKEVALRFAGDSNAAKAKIEAEFDKKKQALEKKEFKRKQKMALVNIAIDTAQAVVAAGKPLTWWMIPAIIAMGAIQAGMVMAQKPPEYWKGTDNAEAGFAWTQERGSELILDKHNRIKSFGSSGGAELTMLEKGDKVKTASETKRIMFDHNLNNLLSDNGIKEAKIEVINKGLTVDEMDSVLSKHFAKITTQHVSFDQRGIQQWSEANGNRTIRNANRGSGIGYRV